VHIQVAVHPQVVVHTLVAVRPQVAVDMAPDNQVALLAYLTLSFLSSAIFPLHEISAYRIEFEYLSIP
jgi:hypothetical protein